MGAHCEAAEGDVAVEVAEHPHDDGLDLREVAWRDLVLRRQQQENLTDMPHWKEGET